MELEVRPSNKHIAQLFRAVEVDLTPTVSPPVHGDDSPQQYLRERTDDTRVEQIDLILILRFGNIPAGDIQLFLRTSVLV